MREISLQYSIEPFWGMHWLFAHAVQYVYDEKAYHMVGDRLSIPAFKIFDGRYFGYFRFFVRFILHMHIESHQMLGFLMAVKH